MLEEHAAPRILIVDDDPFLFEIAGRYLAKAGMSVSFADSALALERLRQAQDFDLIVLDVMMPGEDGMSLCKRLRAQGDDIPILMVTGLGQDCHRIEGLTTGADDYLVKPFNPRELLARIGAVLRRAPQRARGNTGEPADAGVIEFGPFTLDLQARRLCKAGTPLPLRAGQFELLKAFAQHPRRPLSRKLLARLVHGQEAGVGQRALDGQVSRLRKLIEPDEKSPQYIQTVWGVGYVFTP